MTEPADEPTTPPVSEDEVHERKRAHGLTDTGHVRRTRASGAWVSLILVGLLIILMLIFIGQNTQKVAVNFLWLDGRFPLGIALLFAAVAGLLMVALPGGVRIIQLRRALRKNEKESHNR